MWGLDLIHGVGGLGIRGLSAAHARAIRGFRWSSFPILPFEDYAVRRIEIDGMLCLRFSV
jgi:hypothetical protein